LTIQRGVTSIGPFAFASCDKLTEVILPSSLKTLERYAFYWCDNLRSASVPESLKDVADYAFEYDVSIQYI